MRCEKCGQEYASTEEFATETICKRCHSTTGREAEHSAARGSGENKALAGEPRRYPTLRGIATFCKGLAVVSGVATMSFFFMAAAMKAGAEVLVGCVVSGVISVVLLLALAEGTRVIIDIERNTRSTAEVMRQLAARDQAGSR